MMIALLDLDIHRYNELTKPERFGDYEIMNPQGDLRSVPISSEPFHSRAFLGNLDGEPSRPAPHVKLVSVHPVGLQLLLVRCCLFDN